MTEIVISIRSGQDRRFFLASIRVSVPVPGAREAHSQQSTVGGLGEGPLFPDSSPLPHLSDELIINVESGFGGAPG